MRKKSLFKNPNVTLVGEGLKRVNGEIQYDKNGKPLKAIVIGVDTKKSICELDPKDVLPKKVGLIRRKKTDVIETGIIRAYSVPDYQKKVRPLNMGIGCGHFKVTAGSDGYHVKAELPNTIQYQNTVRSTGLLDWLRKLWNWIIGHDEPDPIPDPPDPNPIGTKVINGLISNNHIGANSTVDGEGASIGDPFLQPAAYDGGKLSTDIVGKLAAFIDLKSNKSNLVDASLIEIREDVPVQDKIFGLDIPISKQIKEAELGDEVFKMGRTTGLTWGIVTVIKATERVWFDNDILTFIDQVVIEGKNGIMFSDGGDSGSSIWKVIGNIAYPVLLLFAGSDKITIGNRVLNIKKAFAALGIKIDWIDP